MSQIDIFDEIIVDNFAGGGGASTGIELAAGRPVAIAIDHDPDAILLHKTNHWVFCIRKRNRFYKINRNRIIFLSRIFISGFIVSETESFVNLCLLSLKSLLRLSVFLRTS